MSGGYDNIDEKWYREKKIETVFRLFRENGFDTTKIRANKDMTKWSVFRKEGKEDVEKCSFRITGPNNLNDNLKNEVWAGGSKVFEIIMGGGKKLLFHICLRRPVWDFIYGVVEENCSAAPLLFKILRGRRFVPGNDFYGRALREMAVEGIPIPGTRNFNDAEFNPVSAKNFAAKLEDMVNEPGGVLLSADIEKRDTVRCIYNDTLLRSFLNDNAAMKKNGVRFVSKTGGGGMPAKNAKVEAKENKSSLDSLKFFVSLDSPLLRTGTEGIGYMKTILSGEMVSRKKCGIPKVKKSASLHISL